MKSKRSNPKKMTFTELAVARLKPPKEGQVTYWDAGTKGQLGLSLLVSTGGTKTYRSFYYLHGRPASRKLGRVGELDLKDARRLTREDRAKAAKGIDPKDEQKIGSDLFGDVVDKFIELYAKPKQRTWDQTERALKVNCKRWSKKPIGSITKRQALDLLEGFIAKGHGRKAELTLAWLKTLWRWAWKRDIVTSPLMDAVEIHLNDDSADGEPDTPDYSDDEIRSIWNAATTLDPVAGGFMKLLLLLAPRKTALAKTEWPDLIELPKDKLIEFGWDANNAPDRLTVWVTPFALTKSRKSSKKKRVYLTPLPPLAERIFKSLPKRHEKLVFPGRGEDVSLSPTGPLVAKLVKAGAPQDFTFHAARHTIATWFENHGHDEYDRGLILNHSGGGSVTSVYSHGYPIKRKLELLQKWADHVERLVTAEGAALLR